MNILAKEKIRRSQIAFHSKAAKHTLQLYYWESTGNHPHAIASAVLIAANGKHYVVTASHVYLKDPKKIVFRTCDGNFTSLGGSLTKTVNETSLLNESVDVAYVKIDSATFSAINMIDLYFLDLSNIDINNTYKNENLYYIYGYPASRTKPIKPLRKIKIKPYSYVTIRKMVNIDGYSIDWNIFLKYVRKESAYKDGNRIIGPKQKGMSGCGIWVCTSVTCPAEDFRFKLVGIYTEYRAKRSLIVGTKFNVIYSQLSI